VFDVLMALNYLGGSLFVTDRPVAIIFRSSFLTPNRQYEKHLREVRIKSIEF